MLFCIKIFSCWWLLSRLFSETHWAFSIAHCLLVHSVFIWWRAMDLSRILLSWKPYWTLVFVRRNITPKHRHWRRHIFASSLMPSLAVRTLRLRLQDTFQSDGQFKREFFSMSLYLANLIVSCFKLRMTRRARWFVLTTTNEPFWYGHRIRTTHTAVKKLLCVVW